MRRPDLADTSASGCEASHQMSHYRLPLWGGTVDNLNVTRRSFFYIEAEFSHGRSHLCTVTVNGLSTGRLNCEEWIPNKPVARTKHLPCCACQPGSNPVLLHKRRGTPLLCSNGRNTPQHPDTVEPVLTHLMQSGYADGPCAILYKEPMSHG